MVTEIVRPSHAQAALELELLEIKAEGVETGELYASLRALDLPREAAIRLESLTEVSRKIGCASWVTLASARRAHWRAARQQVRWLLPLE